MTIVSVSLCPRFLLWISLLSSPSPLTSSSSLELSFPRPLPTHTPRPLPVCPPACLPARVYINERIAIVLTSLFSCNGGGKDSTEEGEGERQETEEEIRDYFIDEQSGDKHKQLAVNEQCRDVDEMLVIVRGWAVGNRMRGGRRSQKEWRGTEDTKCNTDDARATRLSTSLQRWGEANYRVRVAERQRFGWADDGKEVGERKRKTRAERDR